ncbi:hypothetical protein [Acinetobacter pecorum]|jgi:hypothetical protein|uniref:Uncharacterized protein n=1 Tax=Acinetobacter pecorum TaxID=2762215 RepID=A0ABR8VU48_9GAMM|nr:hypothetical protein [Acinetobacter pecorum]MBD8008293.1 hypothetical protein [Acinetobacter pecorum]
MKSEQSFETRKDELGEYQFDPTLVPGHVNNYISSIGTYHRVDRIEYHDAIFSIFSLTPLSEDEKLLMRADWERHCPR